MSFGQVGERGSRGGGKIRAGGSKASTKGSTKKIMLRGRAAWGKSKVWGSWKLRKNVAEGGFRESVTPVEKRKKGSLDTEEQKKPVPGS